MNNFFNKPNKNKPNKDFKNKKEVKNLNDLLNDTPKSGSFKTSNKISMKRSSFLFIVLFFVLLASCLGVLGGRLLDRYPFFDLLKGSQVDNNTREIHIEGDFCSSGEAVALKVFPSVVSVKTIIRDEVAGAVPDFFPFGGFPFSFFPFFDKGGPKDKKSVPDDSDIIAKGFGSGIIFAVKDDNAYVMTNFHVVKAFLKHSEKSEIEIYFDGDVKNFKKGEVVGYQPSLDVAVIKVALNGKKVISAEIGDSSKLNRGQEVFVFGTPIDLNYFNSISHGIVSGLNREIQFEGIVKPVKTIQIDAPMNNGNSGGAVCDKNGRVIGMSVAKIIAAPGAAVGSVQGVGIVLPINAVMNEVNKIMQNEGKSNTKPLAHLGIAMFSEKMEESLQTNYYKTEGCIVGGVEPGSTAARAGIRKFDIITRFDGENIKNSRALNEKMLQKHVGEEAEITFKRPKTKREKTVRVCFFEADSYNSYRSYADDFEEFKQQEDIF